MKKFFLALMTVLTCVGAGAQNNVTVDMAAYPAALARFTSGTQISPADAATVYYGSAQQSGFNPQADYVSVTNLYTSGDIAGAYDAAVAALKSDPANLQLLFKAYACATALKKPDAASLQARLMAVCDAIFASGKGVMTESPYLITHTADINEFLVKYIQVKSILGTSGIDRIHAVKVALEDYPDDVIFYFLPYPAR
ncbi:MAG: DUF4919 domain-containing protein [Paramuribaculum sp.]|nr:DUF4919 domain-containing protein [Paramuribaculum sp.]